MYRTFALALLLQPLHPRRPCSLNESPVTNALEQLATLVRFPHTPHCPKEHFVLAGVVFGRTIFESLV